MYSFWARTLGDSTPTGSPEARSATPSSRRSVATERVIGRTSDLLLAQDLVDRDRQLLPGGHPFEQQLALGDRLAVEAGERHEGDQALQALAHPDERAAVALDDMAGLHAERPADDGGGEGQAELAHPHQHDELAPAGDRHLDPHRRPLAEGRLQEDLAAQPVDDRGHDVEADPAAGDLGDILPGREAGGEEEAESVRPAHPGGRRGVDQLAPDGVLKDPLGVDPPSVVRDRQPDPRSLGRGGDADAPGGRLAAGRPLLRRFDAVVDGVADQVEEGLVELAGDPAVEPRLLAGELDLDFPGERAGELPGIAGERLERAAEGLELEGEHLLQLLVGRTDEPALAAFDLDRHPAEHGGEDGEHLGRLRVVEPLLGEPGEVVDPLDDGMAAERHDAHLGGALGDGVERGGIHADVGAHRGERRVRRRLRVRGGGGGLGGRLRDRLRSRFRGFGGPAGEEVEESRVGDRLRSLADRLDHRREGVDDPGQEAGEAGPAGRQHLLGGVAELGESAELEHAAGALDRVQLALGLDHRLGLVFEPRQRRRQALDPVFGLLDEEGD